MSLRKSASLFKNDIKQWQTSDRDSHFDRSWQKDWDALKTGGKHPVGNRHNERLFCSHFFLSTFLDTDVNTFPFLKFLNTETCLYIYLLRSQIVMTTLHLNKNTLTKTEFIKWNIGCHLQKSAENLGKMGRGLYFLHWQRAQNKELKIFS